MEEHTLALSGNKDRKVRKKGHEDTLHPRSGSYPRNCSIRISGQLPYSGHSDRRRDNSCPSPADKARRSCCFTDSGLQVTCGLPWLPSSPRDHRVIVPDLRGMGLSSHPAGGYDKKTQAADIRSVLTELGIDRAAAVVGMTLAQRLPYAYAARYLDKTDRLVVMDAPVPGIPTLGRNRA